MRKLFQAAVLVLSLSIMTASCSKSDPSSSITGTWQTQHKIAIVPDPTEAQKFVEDLRFVVFSGDNVSFKDHHEPEDDQDLGGLGGYPQRVRDDVGGSPGEEQVGERSHYRDLRRRRTDAGFTDRAT